MDGDKKYSIRNFPEEVTEDGVKIYGETSYENQMAVMSHYLHNSDGEISKERKQEIIEAIKAFLLRKQVLQNVDNENLTDEEILK
ncbi:MAG: DNA (cytosine-5-)-methyltransferase, partial [Bacteroidales bacterium]|nr:DNA (cytosine-5-)-methyltransferase [Bacteroidales bacterium]